MSDTLHLLVERYGLFAVFFGCVAEGESAAALAGFFMHQHVFAPVATFLAVAGGAFLGDSLFFVAGRRFARTNRVRKLTQVSGFAKALAFVERRPVTFVMLNRYAYGFRAAGGLAAGMSAIPATKFLLLNLASSMVWACLFLSLGYVFGVGAERVIGEELARHERLLLGFALLVAMGLVMWQAARRRD